MDYIAGSQDINCGKKKDALQQLLRAAFEEHVQEQHEEPVAVYTDGSQTENVVRSATGKGQKVITRKLTRKSSIFTG